MTTKEIIKEGEGFTTTINRVSPNKGLVSLTCDRGTVTFRCVIAVCTAVTTIAIAWFVYKAVQCGIENGVNYVNNKINRETLISTQMQDRRVVEQDRHVYCIATIMDKAKEGGKPISAKEAHELCKDAKSEANYKTTEGK